MTQAILIIVINIVTDMAPYISILEVKFIEVLRRQKIKSPDEGKSQILDTEASIIQER